MGVGNVGDSDCKAVAGSFLAELDQQLFAARGGHYLPSFAREE
jgi:hypothetical protein